jgi:hypothetical protein
MAQTPQAPTLTPGYPPATAYPSYPLSPFFTPGYPPTTTAYPITDFIPDANPGYPPVTGYPAVESPYPAGVEYHPPTPC